MDRLLEILAGISKIVILATIFGILVIFAFGNSESFGPWMREKPIALSLLGLYSVYVLSSLGMTLGVVIFGDDFLPKLPRKKDFLPWPLRLVALFLVPVVFFSLLLGAPLPLPL